MFRKYLFTAAVVGSFAAFGPTATAQEKPKPPTQGVVPGTKSDPLPDYGLGVEGYILPASGFVVTKVPKKSPGGRVGLEAGDIVASVDGKKVTSEAVWKAGLQGKDRVTLLLIDSNDPTGPQVKRVVNLTK